MKSKSSSLALLVFAGLLSTSVNANAITTLVAPDGVNGTWASGILGDTIVGTYFGANGNGNGFIYNAGIYTTLNHPDGINGTNLRGISGEYISGSFNDSNNTSHGFIYNGSSFTTIDVPNSIGFWNVDSTEVYGVFGSSVVGTYNTNSISNGFVYDINTGIYTKLNHPNATYSTSIRGISEDYIVGTYNASNSITSPITNHGFVYNRSNGAYTTLDAPDSGTYGTMAWGVSGSKIVGTYDGTDRQSHGFIYNSGTYTSFDATDSAEATLLTGISGNSAVGVYFDSTGMHGFLMQIPEPSTYGLMGIGALSVALAARRRKLKTA